MANQDSLQDYSEAIKRLRRQCIHSGMSEEEFRKMYFESLNSLDTLEVPRNQNHRRLNTKHRVLLLGIVITVCCMYNFKTIYSCLVCNLQDYVYPGLRVLRKLSIPFISLFPSLTDLYHESCLIQNPFFTIVDMDCWPCSTVNNVRQIYDPKPVNQQHTGPFIYETEQQVIDLETLRDLYLKNKAIFDKESPKILVNNKYYVQPQEIFQKEHKEDRNTYVWRFNNMNMARLLRQVILRPKVVPKFGQSTERFLIMVSNQESFQIPDTECNFSFLLSLSGTAVVNLIPAEECKHQCKSLKVEVKETYLLWYNWWYWRPVIQPSNVNSTLIAHVGSYC
ncbi:uncharacterized protein LOC126382391 isoform X2 [Pectinophora gossypiella]|uniref:uncharacterized protein LOC126382391 isoform X2 n=1 Tax=Pectinophora gossypiella TaxID=13191 RepID=UPI00214E216B|nr:uncharacterized protein LOC126382391 isoform X2 [Pectinophora gossypiella]